MPLRHQLLAGTYHSLKLAKALARPLGLASPHRLRALLYHDIAPHDQARFATHLRWLAQRWRFVSPAQFAAMVSGDEPIQGANLLLTFDDGFASNRVVAEQVLKPMGIQALFFVVSNFVDVSNRDEARQFIARHIQPGVRPEQLPAHLHNMNWADLGALLEQGHSIGAHTASHARLSMLASEADLEREIVAGADQLGERLGTPIEHFAYTFGDIASFSPQALAIARRRFRYIHSGFRGDNADGVSPYALRREAVMASDSLNLLGAYTEGAADFRYASSRRQLDRWVRALDEVAG